MKKLTDKELTIMEVRWEPGRQNGKRIETTFTLPVSFKLDKP
jgi:hypothetical protein